METDLSIQHLLNEFGKYFYADYSFAVWLLTSLVRWAFTGIDRVIHPKFVTLLVAMVAAAGYYGYITLNSEVFDFFKIVTSFGLATMSYDYLGKPIIDKATGKPINQGKPVQR